VSNEFFDLLSPLDTRVCPPEASFITDEELLDKWPHTENARVCENTIASGSRGLHLGPPAESTDQTTADQFWAPALSGSISDKSSIRGQRMLFSHTKPRENIRPILPWISYLPGND